MAVSARTDGRRRMCRAGVLSLKAGRPERSTIKGRHVIVTVLLSRSYRKILVSTIKVAKDPGRKRPGHRADRAPDCGIFAFGAAR